MFLSVNVNDSHTRSKVLDHSVYWKRNNCDHQKEYYVEGVIVVRNRSLYLKTKK